MNTPVSVIIPTYNRATLLPRAIDSVLEQAYPQLELIVVDDGSTDDTARLVGSYGNRLQYLWQENRGPAAARNTGIRAATSPLLAFLDSDDWFMPGKLAAQVGAMQAQPEWLISHTQEIWYRSGKRLRQRPIHRKRHGDIFTHCLALCAVSMSTVILRSELIARVGFFDEGLPCCEDYDYWLRVSSRFPFLLIDEPLTEKDGGRGDQVSHLFRVGMDRFRIRSLQALLEQGGLDADKHCQLRQELVRKCTIYGRGCLKHGRECGHHYLRLAAMLAKEL